MMSSRLPYVLNVNCQLEILVIFHFDLNGRISVLIKPVPSLHVPLTFNILKE